MPTVVIITEILLPQLTLREVTLKTRTFLKRNQKTSKNNKKKMENLRINF